jgi:hypothetical protein
MTIEKANTAGSKNRKNTGVFFGLSPIDRDLPMLPPFLKKMS